MPISIPELKISGGSSADAQNSYEGHLNLGQIQGESNSAAHPNEIEVVSFSWGLSNAAVRSAQGGTTKGGKVTINEITLIKHTDKSTPLLFNAVATCQKFPKAIISLSKSTGGKKPEDYLTVTLTNAYIGSLQLSSPSVGAMGTETIVINFQKIEMDYKLQNAMGILVSASSANYDLTQGT
jgi:type VI secretion system secreted protein Hcp